MTLMGFLTKTLGKAIDFDGYYGAQCVDLVRQYFKDVWGVVRQPEGVVGAKDFFLYHRERPIQSAQMNKTTYFRGMVPPEGAVIVFDAIGDNKFGHIAICLSADEDWLYVLEQDGILNSRALAEGKEQKGAFIGKWSYAHVLGWLTKKVG